VSYFRFPLKDPARYRLQRIIIVERTDNIKSEKPVFSQHLKLVNHEYSILVF